MVLLVLYDCLVHFDIVVVDSWSYYYLVLALSPMCTFDYDDSLMVNPLMILDYSLYVEPLDFLFYDFIINY